MRLRFVALGLATLLVAGGWYLLSFKPAGAQLQDIKAQVEATNAEISALQIRLATLQELKRNEKQLRADARKFEKALPATPSVSDYIRQVEQIANEAGLDFVSITPSAPADVAAQAAPGAPAAPAAPAPTAPDAPGGAPAAPAAPAAQPLKAIGVSLNATGTFFEVENFVAKMEDLDRAVRIDTFNLGAGEGGIITIALQLQMFMQQQATAPTTPATTG